jgi:hypothetical protein
MQIDNLLHRVRSTVIHQSYGFLISQVGVLLQIREMKWKYTSNVIREQFGVDIGLISLPQNQMRPNS